ncbi:unnamed protein product [Chrysoparadoxa australica]
MDVDSESEGGPAEVVATHVIRHPCGCPRSAGPPTGEPPPLVDGTAPNSTSVCSDCGMELGLEQDTLICNECGMEFRTVGSLTLHMQRKTAWSNLGLVGSRVSCLLDNREWQEGVVTQYRNGKHLVSLRNSGEKRWLGMLRTAFYILQRPALSSEQECKEPESDPTKGLAPVGEEWAFCDDISEAFVRAQSLLHRSYGCRVQETGHKTQGHLVVTDEDRIQAEQVKGSLLYGELLPSRGVNKALGRQHMNAEQASVVFDLGMGTGKVAMQAYLQFANLRRVYGVELSQARYMIGEYAVFRLMSLRPGEYQLEQHTPGKSISISATDDPGHVLEMCFGDMFDTPDLELADIVLLETDIGSERYWDFAMFLHGMKAGAHALTYLDLRRFWEAPPMPFQQMAINASLGDRFPTSWSVNRGHHFFLWSKVLQPLSPSDQCLQPVQNLLSSTKTKGVAGGQWGGAEAKGGSGKLFSFSCFGRSNPATTQAAVSTDEGTGDAAVPGGEKTPTKTGELHRSEAQGDAKEGGCLIS